MKLMMKNYKYFDKFNNSIKQKVLDEKLKTRA